MAAARPGYMPRCTKCYPKDFDPLKAIRRQWQPTTWQNYEFVRVSGDGAILRCRNCGHTWRSLSRRAREWNWKQTHPKEPTDGT